MVFSSNSLNRLGQSSTPATSPSMHQAPISTLFSPFSSWYFSPPSQGLHFTLTHLWRALCWSPFLSSPRLLLSLLPSSLVLGTRSSNKTELGACSLMISSPGNWAKHKTDTNAPNPTLDTHSCTQGRLPYRPAAAHLLSSPLFQMTASSIKDTASCQNKGPIFTYRTMSAEN